MGIDGDVLDTINAGGKPKLSDAREQMAHDLAHELLSTRKLSEATYRAAEKLFDEKQLVTLVATVGQFSMTCLTTIAYDCTPGADTPYRIKPAG